jgi:hypothetical protein
MEFLLGEDEVLSRQTGITTEKDHNLWSDCWIALKDLQLFLKPVFLVLPMESLLCEEKVLSLQTGITTENDHNFWSNRWIALKY